MWRATSNVALNARGDACITVYLPPCPGPLRSSESFFSRCLYLNMWHTLCSQSRSPKFQQKIHCPDRNENPYIRNDRNHLLLVSWAQQAGWAGSKTLQSNFLPMVPENTAPLWSLCEQVKMRHILQFPPLKAISISIQATSAAPSGSLPPRLNAEWQIVKAEESWRVNLKLEWHFKTPLLKC